MKVIVAKEMGFCFGVRRAMDLVQRTVAQRGRLTALGELVHNRQVVDQLEAAGVQIASDLDAVRDDTVVVATHGAPEEVFEEAKQRGLKVIDATCPYVRVIQQKCRRLGESGFEIVLLGDEDHTEVRGIVGWAAGPVQVVAKAGELGEEPPVKGIGQKGGKNSGKKSGRKIAILAQTTQSLATFEELVSEVVRTSLAVATEISVHNTICSATALRQEAAIELARACDVVVVVGGQNSANTKRLAELAAEAGKPVHRVEVAADLDPGWFEGARVAGVTAGASTPDWIIGEVVKVIEEL